MPVSIVSIGLNVFLVFFNSCLIFFDTGSSFVLSVSNHPEIRMKKFDNGFQNLVLRKPLSLLNHCCFPISSKNAKSATTGATTSPIAPPNNNVFQLKSSDCCWSSFFSFKAVDVGIILAKLFSTFRSILTIDTGITSALIFLGAGGCFFLSSFCFFEDSSALIFA